MDSRAIRNSDHVYRSLFSDHLYKCSYAYFSSDSSDCMFLFDCHNCTDCFGCVNMRNAKHCVFNQQLSREEYKAFMAGVYPLTRVKIAHYEETFWNLVKSLPMNASHNVSVDNVSGVGITNSQDVHDVVDAVNAQHVRHADSALGHHDSMDILFSGGSDHLYSTTNIGSDSSWVKFSVSTKYCTNSEYVFNSKNIDNCFMCFGLQNKSFCIFNKQYERDDYFRVVDEIKTKLLQCGEYGDGLGLEYSAQAYNLSLGQIAFPLSDDQIIALEGYLAGEVESNIGDMKVLQPQDVPTTIDAVTDEILSQAIFSENAKRPFRIVPTELDFYRRMKLPLPWDHPQIRMRRFVHMAATGKKYKAVCEKCHKSIESYFDPADGYQLYCEACYKAEVL